MAWEGVGGGHTREGGPGLIGDRTGGVAHIGLEDLCTSALGVSEILGGGEEVREEIQEGREEG